MFSYIDLGVFKTFIKVSVRIRALPASTSISPSLWTCLFLVVPVSVCTDRSTLLSLLTLFLQTSSYWWFLALWKRGKITACQWLISGAYESVSTNQIWETLHAHGSFCLISIHTHTGAGHVQQWKGVCLRDKDLRDVLQHVLCHLIFLRVLFYLHI